jgi:2-dehydro-3-deoxyphosphooctonate aldolase (KDO 8-P synthase)
VIEDGPRTLAIARALASFARRRGVPLVFKASFDKANRTSLASYRGPGLVAGLEILGRVRRETGLPLLTDIHEAGQAAAAARVVDVLQVPAFLSRQTDLIVAAARTGRAVNIKKAQFMAPEDVLHAVAKARASGNGRVTVTERGTMFGYRNLVVDLRGIEEVRRSGVPVIFDATHSVQRPGGAGNRSGGDREFVPVLARAACAAGADGLFIEVHPRPAGALSDPATSWPLARLAWLWEQARASSRAAGRWT